MAGSGSTIIDKTDCNTKIQSETIILQDRVNLSTSTDSRRFSRIEPRKLHDRIAVRLGKEIATGKVAEGAPLPTEAEATERLGVSRTAYREAIRVLAGKGLVTSRAKTGTRVNPRSAWALLDPEVIGWMFSAPPSALEVRSLFELRMIVEPAAAALAAERRSADQLEAMRDALARMEGAGLASIEGQRADGQFHAAILEATGNDFLQALVDPIATAVQWTTKLKFAVNTAPRDPMQLHRDLFRAVEEGDGARAQAVTRQLLLEAREDTEQSLNDPVWAGNAIAPPAGDQ